MSGRLFGTSSMACRVRIALMSGMNTTYQYMWHVAPVAFAWNVQRMTRPYNARYLVKYHVFAQILALCRAIKSTNPIKQLYSSGYSAYSCLIGLVDLITRLSAMNLAKSLIVSEQN
jgi:hypothetical protein